MSAWGLHQRRCGTIRAARSRLLPRAYRPADPALRVPATRGSYEFWRFDLCGRPLPCLVMFWPAPRGGTNFRLVPLPGGTLPRAAAPSAPPARQGRPAAA